ncbi:hypothetical protein ACE1TI_09695 [Alteribacillus sp. JSM 102045]|uniref:hypothetical protein n=1 Tax=Alteribacillus sp. JSM 102045 TaxID=1562101 RepID=UPI0035C0B1F7
MYNFHQQPFDQPEIHSLNNEHRNSHHMHEMCQQYLLYMVQLQTSDGQMHEGIIEDVDNEGVTLLMPDSDMENQSLAHQRQFWGGPGYGPWYGYGYPRRFRRFRRFRFPFFHLRYIGFPFFY